uniref:Uncharacterized protein n=1 Tax=Caenorhabditis japonica TaxID=281687 RepID=A0A8R1IJE7_CAEJA
MAQKMVLIATIFAFCFFQLVFALNNPASSAVYRSQMQQRERLPNTFFYMDEVPMVPYSNDIKDPIIKRFKPCYYSPIQCLIKKKK